MDFRDYARIGLEKERLQLIKVKNILKTSPEGGLILKNNVNGHRRYYITTRGSDKRIYANRKMLIMVYKLKQRKRLKPRHESWRITLQSENMLWRIIRTAVMKQ